MVMKLIFFIDIIWSNDSLHLSHEVAPKVAQNGTLDAKACYP